VIADDTIAALKGLGRDEEANAGGGFSGPARPGLPAGNAALGRTLGRLPGRWPLVPGADRLTARPGIAARLRAGTMDDLTAAARR